jgi:hypothetical protein
VYAVPLPPKRSVWTRERNEHYRADRASIGETLCRHGGVVFISGRYSGFAALRLAREAGLVVTGRFPDGRILGPTQEVCRRA